MEQHEPPTNEASRSQREKLSYKPQLYTYLVPELWAQPIVGCLKLFLGNKKQNDPTLFYCSLSGELLQLTSLSLASSASFRASPSSYAVRQKGRSVINQSIYQNNHRITKCLLTASLSASLSSKSLSSSVCEDWAECFICHTRNKPTIFKPQHHDTPHSSSHTHKLHNLSCHRLVPNGINASSLSYIQVPYTGNFRGRKLPQIDAKYDFCVENFRKLLAFAVPKGAMPPI